MLTGDLITVHERLLPRVLLVTSPAFAYPGALPDPLPSHPTILSAKMYPASSISPVQPLSPILRVPCYCRDVLMGHRYKLFPLTALKPHSASPEKPQSLLVRLLGLGCAWVRFSSRPWDFSCTQRVLHTRQGLPPAMPSRACIAGAKDGS